MSGWSIQAQIAARKERGGVEGEGRRGSSQFLRVTPSYKAETLTMLLLAVEMFVAWLGLPGGGLLSPSGVSAGGVGILMMAVVIWEALQFGLSPSSDFILRLERLEDKVDVFKETGGGQEQQLHPRGA